MILLILAATFLLGILAGVVLASRRLRPARVQAPAPAPRVAPGRGAGRPEVQPRSEATGPFGYDNGLAVEAPGEDP